MAAGFGVVLLLFVATSMTVLVNMARVHRQFKRVVQHDAPVLANANQLLRLVVDMETGQRGFCITKKEEYLEPYNFAQDHFYRLLDIEKTLISDHPREIEILERIGDLVGQWLEKAARPEIAMARRVALGTGTEEHAASLGELAALLESGEGKALLDRIRTEFSRFIEAEEKHLAQRFARASLTTIQTRNATLWLIAFSVVSGLTIALLSVRGMVSSIGELVKGTQAIGMGDLTYRIEHESSDEIGDLATAFNEMAIRRQETESNLNREIADRKRAQQQLAHAKDHAEGLNEQYLQATSAAKDMATRAEVANAAKSDFLANMSHEIRTPMNAILGFADLLVDKNFTEQQRHDIDSIRDSAHSLLALINDILDFSKIEAGQLDIEMIDCSLGQVLDSVESMMKPLAEKKSLAFQIVESHDLPVQICSDSARLRQCLINLANNAIKFTEQGHVFLRVSLEDRDNQPFIRFDVEDTGIGIPAHKQRVIFSAFTQADSSTTREYGGTGLGLSVTKQLAELLGGEIAVSSEVGKGSTFSLVIPAGLNIAEQPLLERLEHNDGPKQPHDDLDQLQFSGCCLVAEDVLANQIVIERFLTNFGLEVFTVDDGKEAVEHAQARSYDLIFMDMHMPNMNGYDAVRILRAADLKTPVIALTASAMKGDDQKCLQAGCDDYLAKPIDRKELSRILCRYLTPTSQEHRSITDSIDATASEIEPLDPSMHETVSPDDERVIDWMKLIERGMNEQIVQEIVPIFLSDKRERLVTLAEAVKGSDAEQIRLQAHAIAGGAGNIGATRLSEAAFDLERQACQGDLSDAEALLKDMETEFSKFESFVSRPDWVQEAKQQCKTVSV